MTWIKVCRRLGVRVEYLFGSTTCSRHLIANLYIAAWWFPSRHPLLTAQTNPFKRFGIQNLKIIKVYHLFGFQHLRFTGAREAGVRTRFPVRALVAPHYSCFGTRCFDFCREHGFSPDLYHLVCYKK